MLSKLKGNIAVMNVVLDTNAIKYLYELKQGECIDIKLNGKQINNSNFLKLCDDANNIFVMSESWFELFFQSYKKDKSMTVFMCVYNFLCSTTWDRGGKVYTVNDINGFYFDFKKLVYSVKNGKTIDLYEYIGKRVEIESDIICTILITVCCSEIGLVFDSVFDVVFPEEYWRGLFSYLREELRKIYYKYYVEMSLGIKEFEKELDTYLFEILSTVNNNINIFATINDSEDTLPHTKGDKCGAEYTAKLIKNLNGITKKKYGENSMRKFEQNLNEYLDALKEKKGFSTLKANYLKYLCMEFARGRKIKKNDIPDMSMVTSLDASNDVFKQIDVKNTVFVSFDNFVNTFCQDTGVMYNQDIYEWLCED